MFVFIKTREKITENFGKIFYIFTKKHLHLKKTSCILVIAVA